MYGRRLINSAWKFTELQKDLLLGGHKALLADFLSHCDLVKFARHEPTIPESEKTVSICREFIEETKEEKDSRVQEEKVRKGFKDSRGQGGKRKR